MVEEVTALPWYKGRRWFRSERILRGLMGFGFESTLSRLTGYEAEVLAARDLYRNWADSHLPNNEDNVSAFAHFLTSDFGKPVRNEGTIWLADLIDGNLRLTNLYRDGTGDNLVALVEAVIAKAGADLARSSDLKGALVKLSAMLVSANVPSALALQDRVGRIGVN
ncbi:hypothetical protein ABAC460_20530 [Asticcacaulis sp. AC460]|nr:hypothetical protein ABAC460_20530 [Asticcacaulis sp. AC460]